MVIFHILGLELSVSDPKSYRHYNNIQYPFQRISNFPFNKFFSSKPLLFCWKNVLHISPMSIKKNLPDIVF